MLHNYSSVTTLGVIVANLGFEGHNIHSKTGRFWKKAKSFWNSVIDNIQKSKKLEVR